VNNNLKEAEKELSRWQFRLGHLSFRQILLFYAFRRSGGF
jgi:hypothetical protein